MVAIDQPYFFLFCVRICEALLAALCSAEAGSELPSTAAFTASYIAVMASPMPATAGGKCTSGTSSANGFSPAIEVKLVLDASLFSAGTLPLLAQSASC